MRDFQRRDNRRPSGGRDFQRRDYDRPMQMHNAICSSCGKECEVPFKPTGAKPVFCRDCFQNNRTGQDSRNQDFRERRDFSDRRDSSIRPVEQNYNQQFESLNAKLDKILNLLDTKNVNTTNPRKEQIEAVLPIKKEEIKSEIPVVKTVEEILPPVIKKKKVAKISPEIK